MKWKLAALAVFMLLISGCGPDDEAKVVFAGWGGDPAVNQWVNGEFKTFVKNEEGLELQWIPMGIDDILARLDNEKKAGAQGGIDLIWINGENFYYAQKNGLLYGPIMDRLKNAGLYLDMNDPAVSLDFGRPTDGFEAPWGQAQFVFISDSAKVAREIQGSADLLKFVQENPGVFTYPEAGDFVGSAFFRTVLYDLIGYDKLKDLPPDKETVTTAVRPALDYLNALKPYLWKEGQIYPKSLAQLEALYQNGEVYLTMDYNSQAAYHKIRDGLWPPSSRTSVWLSGTPANTHFLAIPFNSPRKEQALKVINAALSPRMQVSKADLNGWGDHSVLALEKIPDAERSRIQETAAQNDQAAQALLSGPELKKAARPELPAELVVILEDIWREEVLLARPAS